jgi:hypothetical protein
VAGAGLLCCLDSNLQDALRHSEFVHTVCAIRAIRAGADQRP